MGKEDIYELKRDGKVLYEGLENDCFGKLHKIQTSSWDHALKYEGYSVEKKELINKMRINY